MLKHTNAAAAKTATGQPPSGGCVLKQAETEWYDQSKMPAAFGRLCVETQSKCKSRLKPEPAAFGRLCVETSQDGLRAHALTPAAFGRLCVETTPQSTPSPTSTQPPSGGCVLKQRLVITEADYTVPAAFGRLCVET